MISCRQTNEICSLCFPFIDLIKITDSHCFCLIHNYTVHIATYITELNKVVLKTKLRVVEFAFIIS